MRKYGKRKGRRELAVMFVVAGSMFALVACGGGTVQCTQPCEQSSDCKGEMLCLNTSSGFQCLPQECDACFENGRTCNTTRSGSLSDGTYVCTNPYCS